MRFLMGAAALLFCGAGVAAAQPASAPSELLCSPEGLMRLIPQFNVKGQFTIPDPNADLQTFLSAHQGLSNAIDMILARENIRQNPSTVGSLPSRPLIFASSWLSSEVGLNRTTRHSYTPMATGEITGRRRKEPSDKFRHFYRPQRVLGARAAREGGDLQKCASVPISCGLI